MEEEEITLQLLKLLKERLLELVKEREAELEEKIEQIKSLECAIEELPKSHKIYCDGLKAQIVRAVAQRRSAEKRIEGLEYELRRAEAEIAEVRREREVADEAMYFYLHFLEDKGLKQECNKALKLYRARKIKEART